MPKRTATKPANQHVKNSLAGHLLGSCFICLNLIVFAWLLPLVLHGLDRIHPFGEEFRAVLHWLELYSFALDTMMCAFAFSMGAFRFCSNVLRSPS